MPAKQITKNELLKRKTGLKWVNIRFAGVSTTLSTHHLFCMLVSNILGNLTLVLSRTVGSWSLENSRTAGIHTEIKLNYMLAI